MSRPWLSLNSRRACLPAEFQTLIAANLAGGGVCGPVLIKEQLLSPRQLEGDNVHHALGWKSRSVWSSSLFDELA